MYGVHTIHDICRPHLISSANKVNTKVRDLVLEKDFQFPPLRSGYGLPFHTYNTYKWHTPALIISKHADQAVSTRYR